MLFVTSAAVAPVPLASALRDTVAVPAATAPQSDWGLVFSLCAVAIALTAVAISFWQGWETRRFYRLQARPLLVFTAYISRDQEYRGLQLENKGTGPAIIKGFHIYVDGVLVNQDPARAWPTALAALGLGGHVRCGLFPLPGTGALSPGDHFNLCALIDGSDNAMLRDLVAGLRRLHIVLEYTSMYGEGGTREFLGDLIPHTAADEQTE
jgi:hypothetical protein